MFQHEPPHSLCRYPGQGLAQLLILRILHEKPSHGYQIMDELQKMTSEKYNPETGAIYTMLRRMEERGLVTSQWEKNETGADRRIYTLTKNGINFLKAGLEMVKARRELMEKLVQFYDATFLHKENGGDTQL
jgi:PadR family transcriptional regulator PadR